MLPTRGETIISPGAKQGLIPLVIALSENLFCNCTAAVANSPSRVDQYMHRILVEEDGNNFNESNGELFHTASEVGEKLHRRGDFAESRIANFDGYLLKENDLVPWELVPYQPRKSDSHLQKLLVSFQ
ncbi:hypothetical protein NC651_003076 [Populus alba x Populus x berolinensis]|nr:hypothetical protein NC651_003076 [Populus alba x Populus x berolinensis]